MFDAQALDGVTAAPLRGRQVQLFTHFSEDVLGLVVGFQTGLTEQAGDLFGEGGYVFHGEVFDSQLGYKKLPAPLLPALGEVQNLLGGVAVVQQ